MDSACPILKRLAGGRVNLDELDYLAKRLNSFTDQEAAQFQAAAVKFGSSGIKDLIDLTFCCQQTTVVTDFSDLEQIGWNYYLTLHGGRAPTKELERLDARHFALELICNTDRYVKNFLAETLKLELSEKKTKVTHSSDFARFLNLWHLYIPQQQYQIQRTGRLQSGSSADALCCMFPKKNG